MSYSLVRKPHGQEAMWVLTNHKLWLYQQAVQNQEFLKPDSKTSRPALYVVGAGTPPSERADSAELQIFHLYVDGETHKVEEGRKVTGKLVLAVRCLLTDLSFLLQVPGRDPEKLAPAVVSEDKSKEVSKGRCFDRAAEILGTYRFRR